MNMGKVDRIIRALIGVVAIIVSLFISLFVVQVILWVIAAIMLITAAVGFCPLYTILHIKTKK
jgi:hypothetical protein